MISWRTQWFVNMLIFYLVIGAAVEIPGLPALPFFLAVWATLGYRRALLWSVLSQVLSFQWWQIQFFQIGAISGFVDEMIRIVRLAKTDPTAAIQQLHQLDGTLNQLPSTQLGHAIGPWGASIMVIILVPATIWISVRRMRRLRRRLKPVITQLP